MDCFRYPNSFPKVDDVVMIRIDSINEVGVYVQLVEYQNCPALIPLTELSKRRVRSLKQVAPIGSVEPVLVVRVDEEKKFIDLSKSRLHEDDRVLAKQLFAKNNKVHSILKSVHKRFNIALDELYAQFAWKLYREFDHIETGFKKIMNSRDLLQHYQMTSSTEEINNFLFDLIVRRYTPSPVRLQAEMQVMCFGPAGIDGIKAALRAGLALSPNLKIQLIAPPNYCMKLETAEPELGIVLMNQACEAIRDSIKTSFGDYALTNAPHAVNQEEETEMKNLMAKLTEQNSQVAADDEVDDI
jgi:translation initiation factor 2 subunit 1